MTISRFRRFYLSDDVVDDLFYQQVMLLFETGEIRFENAFIDGTKIEANANKYTFVWKGSVLKNEEKMLKKAGKLVSDINLSEIRDFSYAKETAVTDMEAVRILWPAGIHHKKSVSGYRSELTVYKCEDCSGCHYKSKCTKAQGDRRMEINSTNPENQQGTIF